MHARTRALAAAAALTAATLPLTACSAPAPKPAKSAAAPAAHRAPAKPKPVPVLAAAERFTDGAELLRVNATAGGASYDLPAAAAKPGELTVMPSCLGHGTLKVKLSVRETEITIPCKAGEVMNEMDRLDFLDPGTGPRTVTVTPTSGVRWTLTIGHNPKIPPHEEPTLEGPQGT